MVARRRVVRAASRSLPSRGADNGWAIALRGEADASDPVDVRSDRGLPRPLARVGGRMSVEHPAIDARALIEDERYAAYKASLEERRDKAIERLLVTPDHVRSERLKGEIVAYNAALALPEELKKTDPNLPPQ